MHLAFTVTAILLAFIDPARAHRNTSHQTEKATTCKHPSTVGAFAASFYTALIVTQDPNIVNGLEMAGKEASVHLYPIISRVLKAEGVQKADKVSWTVIRAFALGDTLKLTEYFEQMAFDVGEFLKEEGLLDCKNAVSLALDYFKFVRGQLKGLDTRKFESYMQGIVLGMADFFHVHGLEFEVFVPANRWRVPLAPRLHIL